MLTAYWNPEHLINRYARYSTDAKEINRDMYVIAIQELIEQYFRVFLLEKSWFPIETLFNIQLEIIIYNRVVFLFMFFLVGSCWRSVVDNILHAVQEGRWLYISQCYNYISKIFKIIFNKWLYIHHFLSLQTADCILTCNNWGITSSSAITLHLFTG